MPWETTAARDQEKQLIEQGQSGGYSKAELARRFGVSRTTVCEWSGRFSASARAGLAERWRTPRSQRRKTAPEVVAQIVEPRSQLPHRGAKKRKAIWEREHSAQPWPAASTAAGVLQQRGPGGEPHALWCADFKGWFLAGNGERCEPLTWCDACSRYLLRCQLLWGTSYGPVKPVREAAFREYGWPPALRTDKGPPLAVGGLSRLAVWSVRLGIMPEWIDPGKRQQNGRLEGLHQTLKRAAASPPARTWRQQQEACERFRNEYNEQRPQEALGQQTPASCYCSSPREYPAGHVLRRVQKGGQFRWAPHDVFLTRTLQGEAIGLEALDERWYRIWFGPLEWGVFDSYRGLVRAGG